MTTGVETSRSNKNYSASLLRFLLRYVLKKWAWVLLGGAVGAGLGLWLALSPQRFNEAEVAFLMPWRLSDLEELRLKSRDLVLDAAERMEFSDITYSIEEKWGGRKEIYRHSPFQVELQPLANHLMDQEMQIHLKEGGAFDFEFHDPSGQIITSTGRIGKPFRKGGIGFTLQPTAFFQPNWAGKTVYIEVLSQARMVRKYRKGLRIIHLQDEPNKITVRYSDVNHLRVKDFLEAFTEVYMEQAKQRVSKVSQAQLINLQIQDVIQELNSSPQLEGELELAGEKLLSPIGDSLPAELDRLHLQLKVLQGRTETLHQAQDPEFSLAPAWEPYVQESEDSLFLALYKELQFRKMDPAKEDQEAIYRLRRQFQILRVQLLQDGKEAQEQVMAEIRRAESLFSARLLVGKRFLVLNAEQLSPELIARLERLGLLIEKREEVLLKEDNPDEWVTLLESPHLLAYRGGAQKMRQVIAGGLLGMILMSSFFLFRVFYSDKVLMQQQLAAELQVPILAKALPRKAAVSPAQIREMHTVVELKREASDRTWAFAGQERLEQQSAFVQAFAERQAATGKSVLLVHIEAATETGPSSSLPAATPGTLNHHPVQAPQDALALWLLSNQAEDLITAAQQQYDFVFLDLPSLTAFPEGIRRIQQSQIFIHFLQSGNNRRTEVEHLLQLLPQVELKKYFLFFA